MVFMNSGVAVRLQTWLLGILNCRDSESAPRDGYDPGRNWVSPILWTHTIRVRLKTRDGAREGNLS